MLEVVVPVVTGTKVKPLALVVLEIVPENCAAPATKLPFEDIEAVTLAPCHSCILPGVVAFALITRPIADEAALIVCGEVLKVLAAASAALPDKSVIKLVTCDSAIVKPVWSIPILAEVEVPELVIGAVTAITPDEPVAPVLPVAPVAPVSPLTPCMPCMPWMP